MKNPTLSQLEPSLGATGPFAGVRHRFLRTGVRSARRVATAGLLLTAFGASPVLANAVYNAALGAPHCATAGPSCDSTSLLERSGHQSPSEANHPNTVGDSCLDGSESLVHLKDESIERITVSSLDGDDMASGATVRVDVTFFPYGSGSSDTLILSYTGDGANSAAALHPLATYAVTDRGMQTRSFTYTLPEGGVQRVRARLADNNYLTRCDGYGYYDVDELVFTVRGWANPWSIPETTSRAGDRTCGAFEDSAYPPAPGVSFAVPQVAGGTGFVRESPGVLVSQDGSLLWGGLGCGGYCTVSPGDDTYAGCSFMEQPVAIEAVRSLWLDPFFTAGYTDDVAFYEELFAHAMGDDFHQPAGAGHSLSKTEMTTRLLGVVDGVYGTQELEPVLYESALLEGRSAAFLFDDSEARIALGLPIDDLDGGESSQALYLEQLGHLLNWARCRFTAAPVELPDEERDEACPTTPGGSAGARFRDAVMTMGASRDLQTLRAIVPYLPSRVQAVASPDHYELGDQITILGDGQSSMPPIHVIESRDEHRGTYTRSAVQSLLAEGGMAGDLFAFLEQEYGLSAPTFRFAGPRSTPHWAGVVVDGRLDEVVYWLPANTSSDNVEAREFWYLVGQALHDTIYGPLQSDDRCVRSGGVSMHFVKLSDILATDQTPECVKRDSVAHVLAGMLVHEQGFTSNETLIDQIHGEFGVFPAEGEGRSLPGVRMLLSEALESCSEPFMPICMQVPEAPKELTDDEEYEAVFAPTNQTKHGLAQHVRLQDSCEPEVLEVFENPSCYEDEEVDHCVVFRDGDDDGTWDAAVESCDDTYRILCQKAISVSPPVYATYDSAVVQVTEGQYPLRYADEACALEFGANGPEVWTGAWKEDGRFDLNLPAVTTVGAGAQQCARGTKRPCEEDLVITDHVENPGGPPSVEEYTVGRNREREAIYAVATATTTQNPENFDALRVHSINVGAGSCHLVQCEKRREGEEPVYENVLVDCGSIGRGATGLDTAGVVARLFAKGFYSSEQAPTVVVTHADSDHFNHIPNLLLGGWAFQPGAGAVKWATDIQRMYLGGWPEEYVGRYATNEDVTEAMRIPVAPSPYTWALGNGGGRGPMSAYLLHRATDRGLSINGATLNEPILPTWLRDHEWQSPEPADDSTIHQFANCGGAQLDVVVVNTPAGTTEEEPNSQSVRRNRASAVLELRYPSPTSPGDFFRAILPGDALGTTEEAALDALDGGSVGSWALGASHRLLLASHHGSGRHGSNHAQWRQRIFPTHVMYSAGERFKHPRIDVVEGYHHDIFNGTSVPPHVISSGALVFDFPMFNDGFTDADALTDDEEAAIDETGEYEDFFHQNWQYINLVTQRQHYNTRDNGSMAYSVIIPINEDGTPGQPSPPALSVDRQSPPPAP
ncbi:MAG: hypothetical protein AAGC60_00375 [Acidobacteriota bacterium]